MKKTIFASDRGDHGGRLRRGLRSRPSAWPGSLLFRAGAGRVYNWSGPYAGLNVGYEWGKVTNSSINPSGLAGGVQLGYNWQSGQFVFGGETDIQIFRRRRHLRALQVLQSVVRHPARPRRHRAEQHPVLRHGRPRLWRPQGRAVGLNETKTHVGWAGGLGMEVGFTPNWSAKVEYLYMDLGNRAYSITGVNNGLRGQHGAVRRQLSFLSGSGRNRRENPGPHGPGFSFRETGKVEFPSVDLNLK